MASSVRNRRHVWRQVHKDTRARLDVSLPRALLDAVHKAAATSKMSTAGFVAASLHAALPEANRTASRMHEVEALYAVRFLHRPARSGIFKRTKST